MPLAVDLPLVMPLSHRINLEFYSGFGAISYFHKEYFEGDFYDTDFSTAGRVYTNAQGYTLLPTRFGVSLTYIIK